METGRVGWNQRNPNNVMLPNRKPNRLKGFDYSTDALYFVTICVQDRIPCLGEIVYGEMQVNGSGEWAERQWYWLAEQYPYVRLHAFVVMPNHVHGIMEIDRGAAGTDGKSDRQGQSPKIKSLSQLIGAYKTTSSKQIRLAGHPEFAWQRSFHDHIIRNEKAYRQIADYIADNPTRWPADTFFAHPHP
jgi:putative transposase